MVDFEGGVLFGGLRGVVFLAAVKDAGRGHAQAVGGGDFGIQFVAYGEYLCGWQIQVLECQTEDVVFVGSDAVVVEEEGALVFLKIGMEVEALNFFALALGVP